MNLARHHQPFHPADAVWVRRAYRQGWKSGQRPNADIETARARWLKRHDGEYIVHRVCDWEDGFNDAQALCPKSQP